MLKLFFLKTSSLFSDFENLNLEIQFSKGSLKKEELFHYQEKYKKKIIKNFLQLCAPLSSLTHIIASFLSSVDK